MSSNPMERVLGIATGYMASSALYVATHLQVADQLADGPKGIDELARATGTNADALYRILRLLVSIGIFADAGPRRFALNPEANALRKGVPGSVYGIAHFLPDPIHLRVYANLIDSVRTGVPAADTTLGMPLFDYLATDPAWSAIFNDAMTAISTPAVAAAIAAYDFSRFPLIVDVAGGHGEVLLSILKACPESRGVLAEIDHVVVGARPRIAAAGLADRCEAVTCDFFKAVPPGGAAYVMKHIIHDWDDERALTILRNIAKAMGDVRGTVVLLETVIPAGPEPHLGKFIDIEMLAMPGGRERTEEEFRALFDGAGFELLRIVPTQSPLSVVEARRR
jgi:O-methyltransferase domain/Dimerisation domain